MSIFSVSLSKVKAMHKRMEKLGIRAQDLDEYFVRSGGAGGQNVNKVSTCVVLKHIPSGLFVKCQRERSRALNRFIARRILLDKIEKQELGRRSMEARRIAKIRRQKKRRSRRTIAKIRVQKEQRSDVKKLRKRIRPQDY